jgi:hypothetical protein
MGNAGTLALAYGALCLTICKNEEFNREQWKISILDQQPRLCLTHQAMLRGLIDWD